MKRGLFPALMALGGACLFCMSPVAARLTGDAPAQGNPAAVINLATGEGVRLVNGEWRYSGARIVEVDHRAPGPDLRPTGPPIRTHDILPHAGAADFDDSAWEMIRPETLEARRGTGRLSFIWYRIKVTIPERIANFDPTGAGAVFELVVDDYAEIWVNGKQPLVLGQTGGQLIKGFNAPNRVVLTQDARPGQQFQLAVLGVNGPLSNPPGNFIWIRSATLDFYRPGQLGKAQEAACRIMRLDPALDAIVPAKPKCEKVAGGFQFIEGPVWVPDGHLLFSDPSANAIYRWAPDGQVSVYRTKSGYAGFDIGAYGQPGANGLTLDRESRLVICEHGNRRVTRLEKNGVLTTLADRYEGKRLNSPNDLVYRSDGALYFTDPPFGLPRMYDDPRKELPFSGVYCLKDGRLSLVGKDLQGPNCLAFSPDEKYLYVTDWDPQKKVVMRYEVRPDGTLAPGKVFFDMTKAAGEEALDGIKVDRLGHLYVSGPGGIWILSPEGKHLGTMKLTELPANLAWGDEDSKTLYLTARTGLYRVRVNIAGTRPPLGAKTP